MKIEKGMRLESKHTGDQGTVIDIDNYWGWFKIEYPNGKIKERSLTDPGRNFTIIPRYLWADDLLSKENNGFSDSWRDYDDRD